MKLTAMVLSGLLCIGTGIAVAQDAQAEKTIIANERAVTTLSRREIERPSRRWWQETNGRWTGDRTRTGGRDALKDFGGLTKELKITSWDITESKIVWVDATTAIHSCKWTAKGTGPWQAAREPGVGLDGLDQEEREVDGPVPPRVPTPGGGRQALSQCRERNSA